MTKQPKPAQPTLAFTLIVKATDDEAAQLDTCLASIADHVDAIYINLNHKPDAKPSKKVQKVADKYGAISYTTVWENNFTKARNFIHDKVDPKYDFIGWIDTDDTVENPEKMKQVLALLKPSIDGLYIKYDYDHDEFGNVIVAHWVARIVRNNGSFHWKSSIDDSEVSVHETLVERRRANNLMNDEFWFVHHTDEAHNDASLKRNIVLLEGMLTRQLKTKVDPRTLFYLATHYVDANRLDEAKELFLRYLEVSGWSQERSQAYVYLGRIHKAYNEREDAKQAFLQALVEDPFDPTPYIEIGELEYDDGLVDKAISWLEMGVVRKVPPTTIVQKPMDASFWAFKLLAQAHTDKGGKSLDIAKKWLEKAKELRATDPEITRAEAMVDELIAIREQTNTVLKKCLEMEKKGKLKDIIPYLDSLPTDLQDNPMILKLRYHFGIAKVWERNNIAIFCGQSPLGTWGPWSLEDGISGSEEAVIRISKHLTDLGYKVTVYATPGDRAGTIDGVDWRHYWELNLKDIFDIFVVWRSPEFFDKKIFARKKYLWLHDVMDHEEFTPERLANIDRVILLSQFHRSCYPMIEEDKVLYSANGIDGQEFEKYDTVERNPHKMLYTSSQVRGQDTLLEIWDDIKKEVPDATLDLCYGWAGFDMINKGNPERMAWKAAMQAQIEVADGVTDHGKVGQEQLVEMMQGAGVWAYPTQFPEISCITGMKMQAAGTTPVCSDYAALDETVQWGTKIHLDDNIDRFKQNYKKALIKALKHPQSEEERHKMKTWAREQFSWRGTAEGWVRDFE